MFLENWDYQDSKAGNDIKNFLKGKILYEQNNRDRPWSKYSSSQLRINLCLKMEMKYN